MTEVEEVEDMKGKEVMIGVENMTGVEDMKNDVRKEDDDGEHHYNTGYMRLNWVGNIKAREN
jgi:hypothetical protein